MAGTTVEIADDCTAQLDQGQPHAGSPASRLTARARDIAGIRRSVEHGGYGGRVAAPIAPEVMEAAKEMGLI